MAKDKQLVHILLEKDLIKRIDDYRFANRFETRSAAIKHLLELALNMDQKK